MVDTYTFSFADAARARAYVWRLTRYLRDIAIYVDGPDVVVYDGRGVQGAPITRLARESGAIRLHPLAITRAE